ncbi:Receptor-like serine/threonine-protein kinase [Forsythia ovata]|uniref:Receptor-like serine/threonine-protein kinase n=1 Tax=Forsythia ovata TaxID=205694 RepID=A0ABD1VID1_9LAMI
MRAIVTCRKTGHTSSLSNNQPKTCKQSRARSLHRFLETRMPFSLQTVEQKLKCNNNPNNSSYRRICCKHNFFSHPYTQAQSLHSTSVSSTASGNIGYYMQRRRPQPTQHPPGAPATSLTASTSTNDPNKATTAATSNVKGSGLPSPRPYSLCSICCTVSENGVFAFGFWEKDGDDVDEFVVGIRYNLGDKATNFSVWTVGEGHRVAKNSTFRLAMDGTLVLINNPNGIIVRSSNTSSLGVQKACLLDNGNLVLLGNKDEVIWRALVVQQTLYFLVSHFITLLALKVLR